MGRTRPDVCEEVAEGEEEGGEEVVENKCPVCYFPDMDYPPYEGVICPSCGTQFGYDDFRLGCDTDEEAWATLRQEWIDGGRQWWSIRRPTPDDWPPMEIINA